ncbi:hypothetical protein BK784_38765 [Bacillus thuringiensis serovar medellin]|uniref:Uncharacterized protein n=1 Tax=Bacillus thuringiensis subsp. medellin TaxID=79672 RepID=A0A9X6ML47_BACTV|nr:hypothetical protein [Bacillus thuringiensis]OUB82179.1 hypothetical protein BK784_38765 [Bacillus thuringiensis serovar medellin]
MSTNPPKAGTKKDKFKNLIGNKNKQNGEKPSEVTKEIIDAHNEVHEDIYNNVHIDVLEIAKAAKEAKDQQSKEVEVKPVYQTRTFRIREDLLEAIDTLYTARGEKQEFINSVLEKHFASLGKNLK